MRAACQDSRDLARLPAEHARLRLVSKPNAAAAWWRSRQFAELDGCGRTARRPACGLPVTAPGSGPVPPGRPARPRPAPAAPRAAPRDAGQARDVQALVAAIGPQRAQSRRQCWPPTAAPSHHSRRWPAAARRRRAPRRRPRRCGPAAWPAAARCATSHSRTVPSSPPLASSRPSADSATPQTAPVWPCRVASGCPVPVSHSRTVPSRRRWPAAARRPRAPRPRPRRCGPAGWPASRPLAGLPQPHRPVLAAAGQQPPVRRQRHAPDPPVWPCRVASEPPAAGLPQPHRPVLAAAGQQPPVGRERHAPDRAGVALQGRQGLPAAASPTAAPSRPHCRWPAAARRAESATPQTTPVWPRRVASELPAAAPPTAAPSRPQLPLATSRPSPESATPQTPPVWPCRVASGRPLPASHSRTVPSSLPLATSRPSAESATPQTAPVWPCRVASGLPAAGLPQPHRPVPAAAGHQPPVGRERHAPDRAGVALQGRQRAARCRSPTAAPSRPHRRWPAAARPPRAPRPRPRRCGPAGWPGAARCRPPTAAPSRPRRRWPAAARRPRAPRPDRAGVALQGGQRPPGAGLPQPHRPVRAAAGHQPPVRGQRHAPDRAGVALQGGQRAARWRVSHSRTVPSSPPLATSRPSADSATPRPRRCGPAPPAAACGPPPATARPRPVDVPAASNAPSALSATDAGEVERLGQHRLGEVGVRQAGVLRLHLLQVGLPDRQPREVQPAQVAPQQPQQVDHVARPIALLRRRPTAPAVEQRQQPLLCSLPRPCCAFSRCRIGAPISRSCVWRT